MAICSSAISRFLAFPTLTILVTIVERGVVIIGFAFSGSSTKSEGSTTDDITPSNGNPVDVSIPPTTSTK